jgi:hypothetical protein
MAGRKEQTCCKSAGCIEDPAGGQFTAYGYYFSDHFVIWKEKVLRYFYMVAIFLA